MGTFITPWHGDYDIRLNRSQLAPVEFKSGPSYVKHTIIPQTEAFEAFPYLLLIIMHAVFHSGMNNSELTYTLTK